MSPENSEFFSSTRIPDSDGPIFRSGNNSSTVERESSYPDLICMPGQRNQFSARLDIPHLESIIHHGRGTRYDASAVRGTVKKIVERGWNLLQQLALGSAPDLKRSVYRGRENASIRQEHATTQLIRPVAQNRDFLSRLAVPQPMCAIPTIREDTAAVMRKATGANFLQVAGKSDQASGARSCFVYDSEPRTSLNSRLEAVSGSFRDSSLIRLISRLLK
jgi:hypothetical protein